MLTRLLLGALIALTMSVARAQAVPIAGIDYQEIAPAPRPSAEAGIEVVEYFWYRCPHCYALEPLLNLWVARLPAGVRFRRIPAILGKEWALDARVFYSLEAIGELDRLHQPLLYAIHQDGGRRLDRSAYERWVADWLGKHGVDLARYQAAYDSPAVRDKVDRAAERSRQLALEGTPTFEIAGRYVVNPPMGDRRRILEITDDLISQVQADQIARR